MPLPYDLFIEYELKLYQSFPVTMPSINICIGILRNQCFDLLISTTMLMTYIEDVSSQTKFYNRQYNSSLSPSSEKGISSMGTPLLNDYFFGGFLKEAINISSNSNSNDINSHNSSLINDTRLQFFLFDHSKTPINHPYDGFLGLRKHSDLRIARQLTAENSLLSYLYLTKQITHINFAFKYDHQNGGGYIAIDVSPEYKNKAPKCSTNSTVINSNLWSCLINEISIGDKVYSLNNEIISFNSLSSLVIIPNASGMPLFQYIIHLTESKCQLINENAYKIIICDDDVRIESFPDIHFRIEEVDLKIKWTNLMKKGRYKNEPKYISTIAILSVTNVRIQDWVIGLPGFIDYEYIFDQEDMSITIRYSPLKNAKARIVELMIAFLSILCLGSIYCCLLLLLFKKKLI